MRGVRLLVCISPYKLLSVDEEIRQMVDMVVRLLVSGHTYPFEVDHVPTGSIIFQWDLPVRS